MVNPVEVNLALRRNSDYGEAFYFEHDGAPVDFTGYSGAVEIRRYGAEPGDALAAGTVDFTVGGGGFEVRFGRSAINALPSPAIRGQAAQLVYDVRLAPPGGGREVWIYGGATVFAGVTRND